LLSQFSCGGGFAATPLPSLDCPENTNLCGEWSSPDVVIGAVICRIDGRYKIFCLSTIAGSRQTTRYASMERGVLKDLTGLADTSGLTEFYAGAVTL